MTGTLGPRGQRDGWKRRKERGSTEPGLGPLTQLPRLTEALSPQSAPPMASGSAPSIKEGPSTCVTHAWGSEALYYLLDLRYSFYYTKMKKVETGTGASSFPRWQWAAIPRVVPGPASCIRSSCKAISNAHSQVPPSADKVGNSGEGDSKHVACNSPPGRSEVSKVSARHSWLETSASLERRMR